MMLLLLWCIQLATDTTLCRFTEPECNAVNVVVRIDTRTQFGCIGVTNRP
jgi:hypothetical protein